MAEVPSLGADAARARAGQAEVPAEEENTAPAPIEVSTAFIVTWVNGDVLVTPDLNAPLVVNHPPTEDEIASAGAVVYQDFGARKTAALTVQQLAAQAQAMQQQMQAAQLEARARAALAQEQQGGRPR